MKPSVNFTLPLSTFSAPLLTKFGADGADAAARLFEDAVIDERGAGSSANDTGIGEQVVCARVGDDGRPSVSRRQ